MTESDINNIENQENRPDGLNFKKSFWIIFTAIAVLQLYHFLLAVYYGFDSVNYPTEFHLISQLGGIVWFLLLLLVVIADLRIKNISLGKVFNFDLQITWKWFPQVLKYFFGCALFIVMMSALKSETELQLEQQTPFVIALSFITAVVLAPVCEEIAFRGYLYTAMFSSFKRKKERMVVNAMLFASAHVFLIALLMGASVPYYIFVLGYLLAKLYEESRSVVPCMLLHGLNNGLVFGLDVIKAFY